VVALPRAWLSLLPVPDSCRGSSSRPHALARRSPDPGDEGSSASTRPWRHGPSARPVCDPDLQPPRPTVLSAFPELIPHHHGAETPRPHSTRILGMSVPHARMRTTKQHDDHRGRRRRAAAEVLRNSGQPRFWLNPCSAPVLGRRHYSIRLDLIARSAHATNRRFASPALAPPTAGWEAPQ